jgi:CSLREA domain-containing protein
VEHLEDASVPSTFTVNTTLDRVAADDGKLSLREAIMKANTTLRAAVIILQTGVYKLSLAGRLESAAAAGTST